MFALARVLSILEIALSSNSPREDPLLPSGKVMSNYGASGSKTLRRRITDIPADCWRNCLQFVSPQSVMNSRLISRIHSKAYTEFMECQHTPNICHLLHPDVQDRKYQTMEEIWTSILLIPGAAIDLSSDCSIRSLRRFHESRKIDTVRGFDTSSKHDFVSILLRSELELNEKLLWVGDFDEYGMSSTHFFKFYDDRNMFFEYEGPDIVEVRCLLVQERGVFHVGGLTDTWTFKGENKRCFREMRECIKSLVCGDSCGHTRVCCCCAIWVYILFLILHVYFQTTI